MCIDTYLPTYLPTYIHTYICIYMGFRVSPSACLHCCTIVEPATGFEIHAEFTKPRQKFVSPLFWTEANKLP